MNAIKFASKWTQILQMLRGRRFIRHDFYYLFSKFLCIMTFSCFLYFEFLVSTCARNFVQRGSYRKRFNGSHWNGFETRSKSRNGRKAVAKLSVTGSCEFSYRTAEGSLSSRMKNSSYWKVSTPPSSHTIERAAFCNAIFCPLISIDIRFHHITQWGIAFPKAKFAAGIFFSSNTRNGSTTLQK